MLHVICTRLRLGHFRVRVGDSSRHCEEIVKKSRITPLNAIIVIIIIIIIIIIVIVVVFVVIIIIIIIIIIIMMMMTMMMLIIMIIMSVFLDRLSM